MYHGLAHCELHRRGLLMRPQLDGGPLGGRRVGPPQCQRFLRSTYSLRRPVNAYWFRFAMPLSSMRHFDLPMTLPARLPAVALSTRHEKSIPWPTLRQPTSFNLRQRRWTTPRCASSCRGTAPRSGGTRHFSTRRLAVWLAPSSSMPLLTRSLSFQLFARHSSRSMPTRPRSHAWRASASALFGPWGLLVRVFPLVGLALASAALYLRFGRRT
jgi:hypothetical protein